MIESAIYKGFSFSQFVFKTDKGKEIRLFAPEVCPGFDMRISDIGNLMRPYIGHRYDIAFYWSNEGYHAHQKSKKIIELYDSVTRLPVGVHYTSITEVPHIYEGKPVQKYKKRILLERKYDPTNQT